MDTAARKRSLLNAPWPIHSTLKVEGEAGEVEIQIRQPPRDRVLALIERAEAEGVLGDNPSVGAALRFQAGVVAASVFLPGDVQPLFTPDEVLSWPGASQVGPVCMAAILPPGVAVERAKGN